MPSETKKHPSKPAIVVITVVSACIIVLLAYLIGTFVSFKGDLGLWSAYRTSQRYLGALRSADYTGAFSCLGLYEGDPSAVYTGDSKTARENWEKRVKAYYDIGIKLSGYTSLSVERGEDGACIAHATVIMEEQGVEKQYKAQILFTAEGKILYMISSDVQTFFEAAVSGNVNVTQ